MKLFHFLQLSLQKTSMSKNEIIKNYPDLSKIIKREGVGLEELVVLNRYLSRFIKEIGSRELKDEESI